MTVTKTRGANKKLGEVSLGHKITRFRVKNVKREFAIHDDLICASSKLFKNVLQKNRKVLDGECAICIDPLNAPVRDVTFCKAQCGQNVHVDCYERWSETRSFCPSCRSPWEEQDTSGTMFLDQNLDRGAVDAYIKWLYSGGTLAIDALLRLDELPSIEVFIVLLRALTVGHAMKDPKIVHANLQQFQFRWEDMERLQQVHFRIVRIELMAKIWAPPPKTINSKALGLLPSLQVRIVLRHPNWFTTDAQAYHPTFVSGIGNAIIHMWNGERKSDNEDIFDTYMRSYGLTGRSMQEKDSG